MLQQQSVDGNGCALCYDINVRERKCRGRQLLLTLKFNAARGNSNLRTNALLNHPFSFSVALSFSLNTTLAFPLYLSIFSYLTYIKHIFVYK